MDKGESWLNEDWKEYFCQIFTFIFFQGRKFARNGKLCSEKREINTREIN